MKKIKYSRNDFEHWTSLKTRWRDLDAMGHVNHAAYLTFMETARLDFYDSLGFSSRNSGQVNGIILASMNIQYHQLLLVSGTSHYHTDILYHNHSPSMLYMLLHNCS